MTIEEAIVHCENIVNDENLINCDDCKADHKQLAEWLKEFKELKEKKTPKKPTIDGDGDVFNEWLCPWCKSRYEIDYDGFDFCPHCGQAIDWSEE